MPPEVHDLKPAAFDYGAHALKATNSPLGRVMPFFFGVTYVSMTVFLVVIGVLS